VWEAEVRALLEESGATCVERAIKDGHQFRVADGSIICVYEGGVVAFQGKETELASVLARRLREVGAQVAPTGVGAPFGNIGNSDILESNGANPALPEKRVADKIDYRTVPVTIRLVGDLNDLVQDAFLDYTQRFADDLASEVERLEEGDREGRDAPPQFTSHMIHRAHKVVRGDRTAQRKPTKISYVMDVAYAVSGPCFGAMTNYFHSAWQGAIFAGLFVVWLLTLMVKIARRGGQEL